MANVSAHTPSFARGSPVLDYWLVHAEGLTVQPIGARVEEVVVAASAGRAEALIVRSRMTRRRKAIPAELIAAVEPTTGQLLLDARDERASRFQRTRGVVVAALSWLRPRASHVGATTAHRSRVAAARTAAGAAWLAPRLGAGSRTAGAAAARFAITVAVILARGVARSARELERATALAAERGRASLEARRDRGGR